MPRDGMQHGLQIRLVYLFFLTISRYLVMGFWPAQCTLDARLEADQMHSELQET